MCTWGWSRVSYAYRGVVGDLVDLQRCRYCRTVNSWLSTAYANTVKHVTWGRIKSLYSVSSNQAMRLTRLKNAAKVNNIGTWIYNK